jgi:hypothetical protein
MPTPFMHLHIAEQIRAHAMQQENELLLTRLQAAWPAFYLGSVAPDVNAITDIPRAATHFYDLPPLPHNDAYPEMWNAYPQLADSAQLPLEQAMFVAAYSAHLMLDLIWLHEVVVPFFFEANHLGSRDERRLTHFILLTYLDTLSLEALPATAVTTLAQATPHHWLPFVPDAVLREWRDLLVAQLRPNAPVQTVEIYAGRLRMTPVEFSANLHDPDWMQRQVFDRLPVALIQEIFESAVPRSVTLLQNYFQLV